MSPDTPLLLVARRELRLIRRRRWAWGAGALLMIIAWLPLLWDPLRRGSLGLASFEEIGLLTLILAGILLPLLALTAGADLMAGEIEDGTLVPLVTLPISRTSCLAGKTLGRVVMLLMGFGASYGSAGAAVALTQGAAGWGGYLAIVACGLLLCCACGGVGLMLGCTRRGRVGGYGSALITWLVLVFVLDALLLTVLVALAPPPPSEIGVHGHSELVLHPQKHPSTDSTERIELTESGNGQTISILPWIALVNPVQLFRLSALSLSSDISVHPLGTPLRGMGDYALWSWLAAGWLCWLGIPTLLGLRRFRRIRLF